MRAGLGCLLLAAAGVAAAPPEPRPEAAADVLAAHVREQGFPCEAPLSAARDATLTRPDEAAWTLRCKNAAYRVRLIPDQKAAVESLAE